LPFALPCAETNVAQHRIDDADDGIEHQDPDDPGGHRRHDDRQKDDGPVDVGHARAAIEHQRQPERDGVLEDEDEDEELRRMERRAPESAALEELAEVRQPDRFPQRTDPAPGEQAEVEGADRRIDEEDAVPDQRRQEEPDERRPLPERTRRHGRN
jgi:hypothetical protein